MQLIHWEIAYTCEEGTWHNFLLRRPYGAPLPCCLFLWAVDNLTDEDGSMTRAGKADCNGLQWGNAHRNPSVDLSEYTLAAESLARLALKYPNA